jgi:proteasome beta subunit
MYEAGDNDPSTGGPDFVRNLFPMIVTISSEGFQELAPDDVAERFRVINERRTQSGGVAGGSLR